VGQDSIVGRVTCYWLDGLGIKAHRQQWGPPSLLHMHTGSFLGVKQQGLGINHPPPSSAKVKERVELYLHFSSVPSWQVIGVMLHSISICSVLHIAFVLISTHNKGFITLYHITHNLSR
jgi:hypothetical protein